MSTEEMFAFFNRMIFSPIVEKAGLKDQLEKDQLVALVGMCFNEYTDQLKEGAQAAGSSSKEEVLGYYQSLRGKEPEDIAGDLDTSARSIDIGDMKGVHFSTEMWEVVKECRTASHFEKMDAVANVFESKWGNPIDGTYSVDAELNTRKSKGGSGCGGIILVTVLVVLMVAVAAWLI